MKRMLCAASIFIVASFGIAEPAYGKPATAKLRITGGHLTRPLEVTDPEVLRGFSVWHGYMESSRRVTTAPTGDYRSYEVWFYVKFSDNDVRMAFVLYYHPSSAGEKGYIYLPRRGEKWHELNASTIQLATGWFYASREWDARIKPLITAAEAAQRSAAKPPK